MAGAVADAVAGVGGGSAASAAAAVAGAAVADAACARAAVMFKPESVLRAGTGVGLSGDETVAWAPCPGRVWEERPVGTGEAWIAGAGEDGGSTAKDAVGAAVG